MRKNSQQRLWLVCRKSGAVTEHLIRHNAGEDQSERERENDQCGRREPRSGNAQVHHTEIVNCAVEIQTVHLFDLVKMVNKDTSRFFLFISTNYLGCLPM